MRARSAWSQLRQAELPTEPGSEQGAKPFEATEHDVQTCTPLGYSKNVLRPHLKSSSGLQAWQSFWLVEPGLEWGSASGQGMQGPCFLAGSLDHVPDGHCQHHLLQPKKESKPQGLLSPLSTLHLAPL